MTSMTVCPYFTTLGQPRCTGISDSPSRRMGRLFSCQMGVIPGYSANIIMSYRIGALRNDDGKGGVTELERLENT